MEDYKGKLLNFNEATFNDTIRSYTPLLQAINKVAEAYEGLDTSFEFNEAVFRDIIINRCVNVKQQYSNLIEKQIETAKFTSKAIVQSMRENVSTEIATLEQAVEVMFQALYEAGLSDFANVDIAAGKAVLTPAGKEIIRKQFEERISSNDQNELYNLALNLCANYESLNLFLREKTNGGNQHWRLIGNSTNSIFEENGYGKLLLHKNILNLVR
jgi:hypothetical protein